MVEYKSVIKNRCGKACSGNFKINTKLYKALTTVAQTALDINVTKAVTLLIFAFHSLEFTRMPFHLLSRPSP